MNVQRKVRSNLYNRHPVFSQGASLVRTNRRGNSHSLTSIQVAKKDESGQGR